MTADRTRSAIFFGLYAAVVLYAFVRAEFPYVQRQATSLTALHALLGAALWYVAVRAWLAASDRIPRGWYPAVTAADLLVITATVHLTGGAHSDAAMLYLWPLAAHAIRRRPRGVMAVGLACVMLHALATWPAHPTPECIGQLGTRTAFGILLTVLAARLADRERRRVEEVASLREQMALAGYREWLSQEMHDGIQHYLLSIAVRLEFARQMVRRNPARAAALAVDQCLTVRQAADELRHLVWRLRSPAIEQQGLVEAVRDHLEMLVRRAGIAAPLDVQGSPRPLPPDTEQAAFRIVQEALTNAERHAHPTQVRVSLRYAPDLFECVVADDGAGFDASRVPLEPTQEGGFGLCSMRQRADQVGGRLHVDSAPGRGTRIRFTTALEQEASCATAETAPGKRHAGRDAFRGAVGQPGDAGPADPGRAVARNGASVPWGGGATGAYLSRARARCAVSRRADGPRAGPSRHRRRRDLLPPKGGTTVSRGHLLVTRGMPAIASLVLASLGLAVLAVALAGCGGGSEGGHRGGGRPMGGVRLVFPWSETGSEAAGPQRTARITATLTDGERALASGEVTAADVADGQASLELAVPAGIVHVRASSWDVTGLQIGSAEIREQTVTAGQTTQILVSLDHVALIALTTTDLLFGPGETAKALHIRNAGRQDDELLWSLAADQPWVSFDQTSGSGEADVLVSVDRRRLAASQRDVHQATVTVRSDEYEQALQVAVTVDRGALQRERPADGHHVVVYGATPGGITAAVAAARAGSWVVLIEPRTHIGGMITSGLMVSDCVQRDSKGGLTRAFFERVGWALEPHVAEAEFERMVAEQQPRLELLRDRRLSAVEVSDGRIQSIALTDGTRLPGDYFIDATYEFDLGAMVGVPWRVGRESSAEHGESLAPAVEDEKVQSYCYRVPLTCNPDNRRRFERPPGYRIDDPLLEFAKRERLMLDEVRDLHSVFHVRWVTNAKVDVNSNRLGMLALEGLNWDYPDADPGCREGIEQQHRHYALSYLYYLQNDVATDPYFADASPQVRARLRALQREMQNWGLCRDEFVDNDNFPHQLYVREARRMQSTFVLTQRDARDDLHKPDAIAVGDYPIDSHMVDRDGDGNLWVAPGRRFEIPYRALVPPAVTNLLVVNAISSSHVGYCAVRYEPTWMAIGEAAGTAADLAGRDCLTVQDVSAEVLRGRLRRAGLVVDR